MSFFHFDATTAAGAQATITLQNIFVTDSSFPTASASVGFYGDGEVWADDSSTYFLYNWIDPADAETLPGTVPYQIKRSAHVGDDPGSPNAEVWTEIFTSTNLGLPTATDGGTGYANGQTVTIVGGDLGAGGTAATFLTQNVVGGVVPFSSGLALVSGGKYFQAPGDTHGSSNIISYSGGTGSGLEGYSRFVGVEWELGAGYPGAAYTTFTVSIRKGTGPILGTAEVILEADAS